MNNLYYNQMMDILLAHPEGVRVGNLTRAIYNSNCSLFTPDAAELLRQIHRQVYSFLWREQRKRHSPFLRTRWGYYALRPHFVVQLELCFDDFEGESIPKVQKEEEHASAPEAYMCDMFDIFARNR